MGVMILVRFGSGDGEAWVDGCINTAGCLTQSRHVRRLEGVLGDVCLEPWVRIPGRAFSEYWDNKQPLTRSCVPVFYD